jgi:hypothetical protein
MSENADDPAYSLFCQSLDNWSHAVSFGCNLMRASFVIRGHEEGYVAWEDGGSRAPSHEEHIQLGPRRAFDTAAPSMIARYAAGAERRLPWE